MNRIFSVVWNHAIKAWVVASEHASRKRSARRSQRSAVAVRPVAALPLTVWLALATLHPLAAAADLPTGGTVVLGNGSIGMPSGNRLVIDQHSDKLAIDWLSFDIGTGHTVSFRQPGSDAIALNRVLGNDGSKIMGQLDANGRVFLINPNGVLFGRGAQVDVGGLVASTLDISNADFANGHYRFHGNGNPAAVTNLGTISASDGGAVALLGGSVSNHGVIAARLGTVSLAAGNAVTLDFAGDGLLNVQVDQASVDALADNGGLIRADGGQVLMLASAGDALLQTVVNNSGVIEARTVGQNAGRIVLLGDFDGGTVQVAGTLDASAPDGGDGGFIDTSGANVNVADGARVTTLARDGITGSWLIDPTDFTIASGSGALTGSGIGATTLSANLANTSVTLQTMDSGGQAGDIHVDAEVNWSANTTLTLNAHADININAAITATGNSAGLVLNHGNYAQAGSAAAGSDYHVNAPITLSGANATLAINGDHYTLIRSMAELSAIDSLGPAGRYALAQDLDAAGVIYSQALVGTDLGANLFTGTFAGLGHRISNLSIDSGASNVGLFGATLDAQLRDFGVENVSIRSTGTYTGGVVGRLMSSTVKNVYATGTVNASYTAGGLAGMNDQGSFRNSHAAVNVSGGERTGGLIGWSRIGSLDQVHATGDVQGSGSVGGLVGFNALDTSNGQGSSISNAYATGTVTGGAADSNTGGLVGYSAGVIENSFATGTTLGGYSVGGLVGSNGGTISDSYASGDVDSSGTAGGLIGSNIGAVTGSHASGDVVGSNSLGGLIGINYGPATVSHSHAAGRVTGSEGSIGGLIGSNLGTIDTSYATGAVRGARRVGGLIGDNNGYFTGTAGIVRSSYATGAVEATEAMAGGLVGYDDGGEWTSVYWDSYTTGQANAAGVSIGSGQFIDVVMVTSNPSQAGAANYAYRQSAYGSLDFGSDWWMSEGNTRPILRSEYSTTISNGHQLQLMALDLGAQYHLSSDIDLAELQDRAGIWNPAFGFVPVGDASTAFTGTLDGQGHVIRGLTINRPDWSQVALIGQTGTGAQIRDLGLVGGSVYGKDNAAGLVSINYGGVLSDVYSTVTVGSVPGGRGVGGLVARNRDDGIILNSYATGDVSGGENVAGGLVGENMGTVENSYATGNVSGSIFVGGLVGISTGILRNVYATGDVQGVESVGGLAGYSGNLLEYAYATGSVTGDTSVGGLVGWAGSGRVADSFWNTESFAGPGVGGAYPLTTVENVRGLDNAGLLDAGNYAAWNLAATGGSDAVWRIYDGQTAPLLRSFLKSVTVTATDLASKIYDGLASGAAGGYATSLGEALDGDLLLGSLNYTSASKNVGSYRTSDGSLNLGGLYSGQQGYDVSYAGGTLTITPKTITGTITAGDRTYDGTTSASTSGSLSGIIAGDNVGLATSGAFADKNAGTGKTVAVDGNLTGGDASNYTVTFNTSTLADIAAKAITGTITAGDRTYDGTTSASTSGSLSGIIAGDNVGLATSGSFADKNAGTGKTVAVDGNLTGGDASNYTVTFNTSTQADIAKAQLTISANPADRAYDGRPFSGGNGVRYSGFVAGEDAGVLDGALVYGGSSQGAVSPGRYVIDLNGSSLTSVNYDIDYQSADLNITGADVSFDDSYQATRSRLRPAPAIPETAALPYQIMDGGIRRPEGI
ncbi:GLUG motif-containing protein [Pseudoxanthomonas wuyuanensis]|uniref:Filamentous hemagglutinin family N-terminal domain-containing protein n=1 Tax=Pseudoxanthomonas wuyuanensis TaxID=1073196 RepID=A0A286DEA9_9GAMM|nr:GLUG motif-containing protein [Pseudoxanthomonas wuyuanensis]KAF1720057.1 hypothetical protein CSC75_13020 [Pseudoxanthomonas wuyuanensis]SOD56980.1 filamentous hemagglutinin family N-terminal domain-containing protein [Pseudoxanthomonas wuyuanensis]